jgi:uncharacterized membrane protein
MSFLEFLLWIHITSIVVWVGGGLTLHIFALRARQSNDPAAITFAFVNAGWIGQRFFTAASGIALVSGLLLVNETGYSLGDGWISFGFVVLLASAFVGMFYLGPQAERLGAMIGERGADSPEFLSGYTRLLLINRIELGLLFLVIAAMAIKPG